MSKVLSLLLVLIAIQVSSQERTQSYFHSWGYTMGADYARGPVSQGTVEGYVNGWRTNVTGYNYIRAVSIMTYMYRARFNLTELSEESAISLSVTPALAFSYNFSIERDEGGGMINIPLLANYEFGAGSTYSAASNIGMVLGIGVEYNHMPLFMDENYKWNNSVRLKRSWAQPVVAAGVRFWTGRNKLAEINIKYGWSGKSLYQDVSTSSSGTSSPSVFKRAMTARIGVFYILNY